MDAKKPKLTVLMLPWLAHGHIFPYLELAKNLSQRNFQILFCSTPINLASVADSLSTTTSIRLIDLHLPSSSDHHLPPHYHTTKNVPPHLMPKLFKALRDSSPNFFAIVADLKPDLLIYDVFLPWAARIATSAGIPAIHFATSGAAAYSFYYHHVMRNGSCDYPYDAIYLHDFELKRLIPKILGDRKDEDSYEFAHFSMSCEIVLMKTCRGIEGKYIDYFSELCGKKMVPVGPLVVETKHQEHRHSDIMQWLNKKDEYSTVFVSLGSENYLSEGQIREMAKGLEISGANFIWVVRFPPGEISTVESALPEGFLERVKERGIVVEWAPQAKILANKSVGGFVSHCGMSSTIESIYYGVPLIGLPMKLDQPMNARLAVEVGVGAEVARDGNGRFGGDDVAAAIKKVVVDSGGEIMRVRARKMSEKMKSEEEGAMDEAAAEIRRICAEYKRRK